MRIRHVTVSIIALVLSSWVGQAEAGCGCTKPPPPLAAVRPAFAPAGSEIRLFDPAIVEGASYSVTFGAGASGPVPTTAVLRRDFADDVEKPQLVLSLPELPLGPTSITVEQGASTILTVPASDFTVLQQPIPLDQANEETVATCYRAAVGADGTVYFPLDISSVADRTFFSGALRGYRLTFDAEDIVIYNSQGVLMQLLGPDEEGIFSIEDDQAAPVQPPAVPDVLVSSSNDTATVNFDPDALVDLTSFTSVVGDLGGFRVRPGTGNPASEGIEFDASQDTQELLLLPHLFGELSEPGARVKVSMDVKPKDDSEAAFVLGIFAGGGGTAFLELRGDGAGQMSATFLSGEDGTRGLPVGAPGVAAHTANWLHVEATFEYSGTDIVATGQLLDIGPDGTALPASLLQIGATFSNDFLEGNAAVLGGFGLFSPAGANSDDTRVDNFAIATERGTGVGGDGGDPTGDGVNQNIRSFRLTFDRHEFATYRLAHASDPDFFLDPTDRSWHADGSRHVDHDHLIVAISGLTDAGTPPDPGQTPIFDFRTITTLADAPAPPEGAPKVFTGACPCGPVPAADCRLAGRSKIDIRDQILDRRDTLVWKWQRGEATDTASFGHPMATDDAALCVYDEAGEEPERVLRAVAPAAGVCPGGRDGKPCWRGVGRPIGSRGYKYRDKDQTPDGIDRIVLRPGPAGKAKIEVKARRENLPLPTLPLNVPLRVQLQMSNGQCWEAIYSEPGVKKNTAEAFKAQGG